MFLFLEYRNIEFFVSSLILYIYTNINLELIIIIVFVTTTLVKCLWNVVLVDSDSLFTRLDKIKEETRQRQEVRTVEREMKKIGIREKDNICS